ncbi:MAG TPA: polysaccharide deacetylase family protein [Gammaproteobacteria bacterium]|jgi:peptidoglycan/xylan/chitin deacetylase (PgdA/CDA1 family)
MIDTASPRRSPFLELRRYEPRIAVAYTLLILGGWLGLAWPLLWPGLVALLLWVIAVDGVMRPGSGLFIKTVKHGPRESDAVALSFDDGPDPEVTPALLDELKRQGASATFFVVGTALAAQAALGRRMIAEGHVVANHSWQHSYMQSFRLHRWQTEELLRAERGIEAATGWPSTRLYRAPVGIKTGDLARAADDLGLRVVAWSVHSRDTLDPDPQAMARRVLKRIRAGDIVLLHDGGRVPGGRKQCVEAVRLILAGLREKGLRCVTLTELLGPTPGAPP